MCGDVCVSECVCVCTRILCVCECDCILSHLVALWHVSNEAMNMVKPETHKYCRASSNI